MRKSGLLAGLAVAGLLTAGAHAQNFGPYQATGGVVTENFDSMGVGTVVPNDGVAFYHWNVFALGEKSPGSLGQNGGSTDPDWVNWGTPSYAAAGAYNQGMETNPDRALGLYKTGTTENPMYLETAIQTDVAGDKVVVTFDVEVPMARFNDSAYTTYFDVSIDGNAVGSSPTLVNNSNLTPHSWTDDTVHFWLDDAAMDAGGLSARGVSVELNGSWAAGDIITIKWEIPVGGTRQRMHTGLDNVTIAVVPEPASLALLGLGGLAMLRRRKA